MSFSGGGGAPGGFADGAAPSARFSEPAGSPARNTLVVADTNNHRVRVLDLSAGAAGRRLRGEGDAPALAVGTLEIDLSRHAHAHPAAAPQPPAGAV